MNTLTGKVAIVTGASKGIGAALAKGLAAAGAAVAVNYSADKAGADHTVAEITSKGGQAIAVQADVSNAADVKRLFEATKQAFGAIDVVVNNAGVFQLDAIEAITEQEFRREFDTNVLGTILAIQEALKHFPASGGSVINISSIASENPLSNFSLSCATKGGDRYAHDGAGQGTGSPQHPGQCRGARLHRDRRDPPTRWLAGAGPAAGLGHVARRPVWTARGHCPGRRVPRLG
jgi:NAD(P)-dependent dehydrogenase (short-subunit alcohol dehydrogenase family)